MPNNAEYELQVYQDKRGKYRWRFICTNNNEIMAISSQGYVRRDSCVGCATTVLSTKWKV